MSWRTPTPLLPNIFSCCHQTAQPAAPSAAGLMVEGCQNCVFDGLRVYDIGYEGVRLRYDTIDSVIRVRRGGCLSDGYAKWGTPLAVGAWLSTCTTHNHTAHQRAPRCVRHSMILCALHASPMLRTSSCLGHSSPITHSAPYLQADLRRRLCLCAPLVDAPAELRSHGHRSRQGGRGGGHLYWQLPQSGRRPLRWQPGVCGGGGILLAGAACLQRAQHSSGAHEKLAEDGCHTRDPSPACLQILNNTVGPGVTAEMIDVKENTQGGLIQGNYFDGSGEQAVVAQSGIELAVLSRMSIQTNRLWDAAEGD